MTARILLVEDDEELQEIYASMLSFNDYQLAQAYDGGGALEMLEEAGADLIVLDIILDEMMGDDLYMRVKQDARFSAIPVVVVSALPAERCQLMLEMDPTTVFLRKPFGRRDLVQAIENGLEVR
ncbi:MAG: response regulator [Anaerolineae bacterium]|jgi:CheY-like chemotaxis protein